MLTATVLLTGFLAVEPAVVTDLPADSSDVRAPAAAVEFIDQPPPQQQPDSSQDPATSPAPQDKAEEKKPPTPVHTGVHALFFGLLEDVKHLPSIRNAQIAAIGGGVALIAHPFDEKFNIKLRSHYNGVNQAFRPGKWVGQSPVQMGAALSTFAFGRITDTPKVSHLGMDLLRAQILTEGMTVGLKYATRRERPDGSNHRSFPSGHASVTFATATVIERHLGWRMSALGYTIASYVAASRLHDNRHWLSDVAFGAAVGTIAGRTVTQHGRNYWTATPTAVPGGFAFIIARNPQ